MAAKVTPVKFGTGPKSQGQHRVKNFNMFDEEAMEEYSELRTKANDASSGIKIEQIREYSRKTVIREGAGQDLVVTTTEDIILVVHYWEKKPKREKGDSDDELVKTKEDWGIERKAEAG